MLFKYLSKLNLAVIIVLLFSVLNVSAAVDPTIQKDNANSLVKLGILKGYEDGSLKLENKIKRSEFITLTVNFTGNNSSENNDVKITFKDITKKHWAYENIRLAIKYKLVNGYPDNTIRPDNNVTYAEALAVIISSLGYENTLKGTWPNNVVSKAGELGINKNLDLSPNQQITRGQMSIIIYNALTVKFNK